MTKAEMALEIVKTVNSPLRPVGSLWHRQLLRLTHAKLSAKLERVRELHSKAR